MNNEMKIPKLYVTWVNYFATGEGSSIFINVTYSESKEVAIQKLKMKIGEYGDYFIRGVECQEFSKDLDILKLFTDRDVQIMEGGAGGMDIYYERYFNLS